MSKFLVPLVLSTLLAFTVSPLLAAYGLSENSPQVVVLSASTPSSALAGEISQLINEYRSKSGLSAVTYAGILETTAQYKADDIIALDYWSHTSLSGETFSQILKKADYDFATAGENLSLGLTDPRAIVDYWINSPAHNAVLLHPKFSQIGVGISSGDFKSASDITIVALHLANPTQ